MSNHLKSKINKHVNVGTIGHIDHGFSKITRGITLNTGDYIDPTPWTPEDHDRFKKAIDKVRHLRDSEIKKEIQKSISAGAGVIYVDEKVEK
jgi:translation elongation factor EF-Tu-like GTPase